jgi:hypothetical protein
LVAATYAGSNQPSWSWIVTDSATEIDRPTGEETGDATGEAMGDATGEVSGDAPGVIVPALSLRRPPIKATAIASMSAALNARLTMAVSLERNRAARRPGSRVCYRYLT